MRHPMNEIEAASSRVIKEIAFQASLLALQDAIQAATCEGTHKTEPKAAEFQHLEAELQVLVKYARQPSPRGV